MATSEPKLIRDWRDWLDHATDQPATDLYALDLETTGLSPWNTRVAVVGLYHEPTHTAGILHFPKRDMSKLNQLPAELVEWLSSSDRRFVCFNGVGFDWYFLHECGVDIFAPTWTDAMITEGCTLKTSRRDVRVSLAATYKRRLKKDLKKEIDHRTWQLPELTDDQLSYVAADIMYLPKLDAAQRAIIAKDSRQNAFNVEQELTKMVAHMTINGFPVRMEEPTVGHTFDNGAKLESFPDYIEKCRGLAEMVQEDLRKKFGRGDLNVGSWRQVQTMFLELNLGYKTKTDEASLVRLRDENENREISHLAETILFVRGVAQRAKMYKPAWFEQHVHEIRPGVHVIRPRYWQVGTDTGRFSSSDPNIQQVAGDCRTFFGEEEGKVCLTADYSQLEVRIQAWLCRDEALLEACDAEDMHSAVASAIFQVPIDQVTPAQRKLAKAGTFTFLFGGGAQLLFEEAITQGSHMTINDAKDFEAMFFGRFRGLAHQKSQMIRLANEKPSAQLTMPHGLIRQVAGDDMKPTVLMNTKVQGGAASGLKMGLVMMLRFGLGPYTHGTVHDENITMASPEQMGSFTAELDFSKPAEEQIAAVTRYCMEEGMLAAFPGELNGRKFPVKVEGHIGRWWKGRGPYTEEELLMKARGGGTPHRHRAGSGKSDV